LVGIASGAEFPTASRVPHSAYPMSAARALRVGGQVDFVGRAAQERDEPQPLLGGAREAAVLAGHRSAEDGSEQLVALD